MKTQKEYQLEQDIQKLARESKTVKRNMPVEQRMERHEKLVASICDVLLKISLVPR
jgi:hypothetical protein